MEVKRAKEIKVAIGYFDVAAAVDMLQYCAGLVKDQAAGTVYLRVEVFEMQDRLEPEKKETL